MSLRWLAADWPAPPGVVAGTTLRVGGVSAGAYASLNLAGHVGDSGDSVAENRHRFAKALRIPAEPRWLNQTHSASVAIEYPDSGAAGTDALVASGDDAVCVVLTADCLPVLLVATDGSVMAAAHAGWRGLCNGILEATVRAMRVSPEAVMAWLGPAISQPAFEVGGEVREQFLAHDVAADGCFQRNARGRYQADLYELARRRLSASGVTAVYGGGFCTFGEPRDFFSYRRERITGRMASLIWLQP